MMNRLVLLRDRINNLPEVKYYEKDIESIKEDFEKLRRY